MFKRKIIDKLEEWKNADRHKPLILRGARQVGKTTIVNEFGSQFENNSSLKFEYMATRP